MKKNKGILLVNDLHLNKDNTILIEYIVQQIIDVCFNNGINVIFWGGDIFTNRPGQHLSVLKCFSEILLKLEGNNIQSYAIPGNHDKVDYESEDSYLDIFDSYNFKVFRNFSKIEINGRNFVFAPFFRENLWSELLKENKKMVDSETIMITHIGVNGVRNNDGTIVDSGVPTVLLNKFKKVLVGHYHNASSLNTNIFYTGSCYQNNFGEKIKDKGFTIIEENGDLTFIPSVFPRYIKKKFSLDDINNGDFFDFIENNKKNKSDFIRLIFNGKKGDFIKIPFEELTQKGFDVKFESVEQLESMKYGENEKEIIFQTKSSLKKDFIKFCSENNIKGEKLIYGLEIFKNI